MSRPVADNKIILARPEDNAKLDTITANIRRLYPYTTTSGVATFAKTIRLEVGINLLVAEEILSHHGDGAFGDYTTKVLKIPRSTAYVMRNDARTYLERESLSKNGTKSETEDIDIDISNPEEVAEILANAYKGKENIPKHTKRPKPYVRSTQLHFHFDTETRRRVAAAWTVLKSHPTELAQLSKLIAQEVVNAANSIKTKTKS
jgi:hypothetical protein